MRRLAWAAVYAAQTTTTVCVPRHDPSFAEPSTPLLLEASRRGGKKHFTTDSAKPTVAHNGPRTHREAPATELGGNSKNSQTEKKKPVVTSPPKPTGEGGGNNDANGQSLATQTTNNTTKLGGEGDFRSKNGGRRTRRKVQTLTPKEGSTSSKEGNTCSKNPQEASKNSNEGNNTRSESPNEGNIPLKIPKKAAVARGFNEGNNTRSESPNEGNIPLKISKKAAIARGFNENGSPCVYDPTMPQDKVSVGECVCSEFPYVLPTDDAKEPEFWLVNGLYRNGVTVATRQGSLVVTEESFQYVVGCCLGTLCCAVAEQLGQEKDFKFDVSYSRVPLKEARLRRTLDEWYPTLDAAFDSLVAKLAKLLNGEIKDCFLAAHLNLGGVVLSYRTKQGTQYFLVGGQTYLWKNGAWCKPAFESPRIPPETKVEAFCLANDALSDNFLCYLFSDQILTAAAAAAVPMSKPPKSWVRGRVLSLPKDAVKSLNGYALSADGESMLAELRKNAKGDRCLFVESPIDLGTFREKHLRDDYPITGGGIRNPREAVPTASDNDKYGRTYVLMGRHPNAPADLWMWDGTDFRLLPFVFDEKENKIARVTRTRNNKPNWEELNEVVLSVTKMQRLPYFCFGRLPN